MFGQDRNQLRQMFFHSWQKHQQRQTLTSLELSIVSIIELHPEYHAIIQNPDSNLDRDFTPEMGQTNPFLHMSMHIALHEQISTNRPEGIQSLYERLCHKYQHPHDAEHAMMECLGEALWQAQRNQQLPDEQAYLTCLNKLL